MMGKRTSKPGKITIKHFLNTKAKAKPEGYPIYVSVWFQNRETKIRSSWPVFSDSANVDDVFDNSEEFLWSEKDFKRISKDNQWLEEAFNSEKKAVEEIIRYHHEKTGKNLVYGGLSQQLRIGFYGGFDIISKQSKIDLQVKILDSAKLQDDERLAFVKSIINWGPPSFINIFDGLSLVSKDKKNSTLFYRDILSEFELAYKVCKLIFDFEYEERLRFWNWLVAPSNYMEKFLTFISRKGNKNEANDIINFVNLYLEKWRIQRIEVP